MHCPATVQPGEALLRGENRNQCAAARRSFDLLLSLNRQWPPEIKPLSPACQKGRHAAPHRHLHSLRLILHRRRWSFVLTDARSLDPAHITWLVQVDAGTDCGRLCQSTGELPPTGGTPVAGLIANGNNNNTSISTFVYPPCFVPYQ